MSYEQVYEGEWIDTTRRKGDKVACCDCGLVHTIYYRIRNGRIQYKVFRDNRATAGIRRGMKRRKRT